MEPVVGLIVPPAAGAVPPEGAQLYPQGVRFIAAGLGLTRLTPEGYDAVIDRIADRARALAAQGAQALALMGTSLSFYRGYAFNEELKAALAAATGLPATTMSTAVVEALRALGVRRVAVGTAYIEEVNARLRRFLEAAGFEVAALEGLGIDVVGQAGRVPAEALIALGQRVFAAAPRAEGILLSCGGLRTLEVTVPLEAACGVPVVSSTPAAFWAAVRLVGHDGRAPGYGRLFALGATSPPATTAS
ncbi:MAG TPA: aspartate/glutamate racemase family protein [Chloroflexota bacterium]|nr:aspartate/glutamate racemase family protein [Chloroflexota bacterium]